MDLKELWNSTTAEEPSALAPEREALAAMLRKDSGGVLKKLRNKLFQKLLWGAGIGLALLLVGIFTLPNVAGALVMFIAALLCFGLMAAVAQFYRKLPNRLDMSREILPVMKEYDRLLSGALRVEEKMGNYLIVASPIIGALYSGLQNHPFNELVSDWKYWLLYLGLAAVYAPLGIWASKWMNKIAFGKYMGQLKTNIEALEEVESEIENSGNFPV